MACKSPPEIIVPVKPACKPPEITVPELPCKPSPKMPDKNIVPVIRGFQFTFPDGIVEDKLLFESILNHALNNVSDLGGKMVIAFPDSTPAKVRDYGRNIPTTKPQQKKTRPFDMLWPKHWWPRRWQSDKSDLDHDNKPAVQRENFKAMSMADEQVSSSTSDGYEVEIVGITVTESLSDVIAIYEKITSHDYTPNISLVKLINYNEDEVLRVTGSGSRVTFINYDPESDDLTIQFFKVEYADKIIWISRKAQLPINVRSDGSLYAEVPSSIPGEPPSTDTNLRTWLESMLTINDSRNSVLFKEHVLYYSQFGDLSAIHQFQHEADLVEDRNIPFDRISKEQNGSSAIIHSSNMRFSVETICTYQIRN